MRTAAKAGTRPRLSRVISQADAATRDAKATLRAIDRAGDWRPGNKLVKELRIGAGSVAGSTSRSGSARRARR